MKKILCGNRGEAVLFFLLGLALLLYSIVNHSLVDIGWIMSPYLFPLLISLLLLIFSGVLFFENQPEKKQQKDSKALFHVAVFCGCAILYDLVLPLLGFIPATVLFLAAALLLLGERKPMPVVLISVLTPLVIYFIFGKFLHVMLP